MSITAERRLAISIEAFRAFYESRPDEEHWELIDGVPMIMACHVDPPTDRQQSRTPAERRAGNSQSAAGGLPTRRGRPETRREQLRSGTGRRRRRQRGKVIR